MVTGFYVHGDVEFAGRFAPEDAVGGGYVGIVAADGGADMAMVGNEVVGGIKADPAEMGKEDVNPCVSRVWGRAVVVFAAAIEIAGNVACRNPDVAEQRDHGVGKVLANALSADNGVIDR